MKPFETKNKAYLTTEVAGDKATKVVWGFEGHGFPFQINVVVHEL